MHEMECTYPILEQRRKNGSLWKLTPYFHHKDKEEQKKMNVNATNSSFVDFSRNDCLGLAQNPDKCDGVQQLHTRTIGIRTNEDDKDRDLDRFLLLLMMTLIIWDQQEVVCWGEIPFVLINWKINWLNGTIDQLPHCATVDAVPTYHRTKWKNLWVVFFWIRMLRLHSRGESLPRSLLFPSSTFEK